MPGGDQAQGLQPSVLAPADGANGMEGVQLNYSGESPQQGGEKDLSTARCVPGLCGACTACAVGSSNFASGRGEGQHCLS